MKRYKPLIFIIIFLTSLIMNIDAQTKTKSSIKLPWDSERVKKAKDGDVDAQTYVGRCYYFGEDGVLENNVEAIKWFNRAYQGGSLIAKYYLGLAYLNGFGVTKDRKKGRIYCDSSMEEIEKLADKGDANSQFFVGSCYEYEAEDLKTALKYYLMAAEQDNLDAQLAAASVYEQLYGVTEKAFYWYEKALKHDSPIAQYKFGEYYEDGFGVDRCREKAADLYLQSAHSGYHWAMARVGKMYEDGWCVSQDISSAIQWYKKAIEHDNCRAEYQLACLYRDGYGVNRNYQSALKYMKMAVEHELKDAILDLKDLQAKGPSYYNKLPLRSKNEEPVIELLPDDPFCSLVLSDNWDELPSDIKKISLMEFKKEKIREWGEERATKVAKHLVEIGFTEEQVKFSQGISPNFYKISTVHYSNGNMRILEYPHCIYYFLNDSLIAMLWSNGIQIGDKIAIKSYTGDIVVTEGNK